ncbi:YicC family protein [Candidatus Poribacteria bacterium]|nr:YicC family protein [Candidatus Poribacteria bacterium]
MKSMTGYGYMEIRRDGYLCKVKIHAVNQRYFEVITKISSDFLVLEHKIKEILKTRINRGRVSVFVELEKEVGPGHCGVDMDSIRIYYNLIKELNREFNLNESITAIDLLKLKDVIKSENSTPEVENIFPLVNNALSEALVMFDKMRLLEGSKLKEDIEKRIAILDELNSNVKKNKEQMKTLTKERLEKKFKELLPDIIVDENIIKLEFALFIDRSDITEEIVRISSHLNQFKQIINNEETQGVGKQLDFICQELNREFNTIGAKANFYEISDIVIKAKCELEKIREQIQNVE